MTASKAIRLSILLAFALAKAGLSSAHAAQATWLPAATGDWFNATNWSGGTIPGASDTVYISGTVTAVIPSGSAAASDTLNLGQSGAGSLSLYGTMSTMFFSPTSSSATISGPQAVWSSDGFFAYSSTISVENGGRFSTRFFQMTNQFASSSSGLFLVTGSDSRLDVSGNSATIEGVGGYSLLSVQNGGFASFQGVTFNSRSGALISGAGSRLDAQGVVLNSPSQPGVISSGLQVENGGTLTTASTTINSAASPSTPIVRVTGAGSRWENQGSIEFINNGGLRVENGGTLAAGSMSASNSRTGTLVLAGGTLQGLQSYSPIYLDPFISQDVGVVLDSGGGTIDTAGHNLIINGTISGGGSLTKVGDGTLITSALTHTGSTFVRGGTMRLFGLAPLASGVYVGTQSGDVAAVQMNVAADVYAGSAYGASGTVTPLAPFNWNNGNKKLVLGDAGQGFYLGVDSTYTSSGEVILGRQATGVGRLELNGASAAASSGAIVVGEDGTGTVSLTEGGVLTTTTLATLGLGSSSSGLALVSGTSNTTGSSSRWNVAQLRVAQAGNADLIVTNGGQVQATKIIAGYSSTGSGVLQVGQGSSLRATDLENILGGGGSGSLTVSGGSIAEFGGLTLGDSSLSNGIVEITDNGSRLSLTGVNTPFTIGRGGFGSALVLAGGTLTTNSDVVVANSANSGGSIHVSGAGSTLGGTGGGPIQNLTLGQAGNAQLLVANGALVSFRDINVAGNAGSTGTFFFNGGSEGTGTLEFHNILSGAGSAKMVFDGGTLRATGDIFPLLPYDNAVGLGTGDVVLAAGGGFLDLNNRRVTLSSGFTGDGNLTLTTTGTLMLGATSTHSGTTSVLHATLRAGAADVFSAASSIVLGDATDAVLDLNDLNQTIGSLGGGSAASVTLGAGTLTTGANHASSAFSGSITGSGALVKVGAGTMVLSGSNPYTGGTYFRGGSVEFSSFDNLGSGALTFDGGALRYATGNTVDISSRTVTFAAGGAIIDTNSGSITLANSIGNGGTGSLTKTGDGSLILTGSNSYTGTTFVEQGTLQASNANALPDEGDVVVASAGIAYLAVRNAAVSIGGLSGGGANSGIILGSTGYLSVGADNSSSTFAGVVQSDAFINGGAFLKVGTGTLTLTNGGFMGQTAGVLGGVMLIDGGGVTAGNLVINNNARLELRNGGSVITYYNSAVGANDFQSASMLVTGNGSRWEDISDFITVSNRGSGTLTVANGGTVIQKAGSGEIRLGAANFLGTLNVGEYDTPSTTAGTVQAAVVVGDQYGGLVNFNQANPTTFSARLTGNITVDQRGSGLTVLTGSSDFSGALNIRSGTLEISNGGSVTNSTTSGIAAQGGGATLNISGTGANWTNLSDTLIGHNGGTGTLVISDGATASDTFALVGRTAGGTGHVTVTGAGSAWNHSSGLVVGTGGTGSLLVSNGGRVSNTDGWIGGDAGSSGTATVTGTGSIWTSSDYMIVGGGGAGVLNVANNGIVKVGATGTGTLTLAQAGSGSGTLNIGAAAGEEAVAAGTLQVGEITGGGGSGTKLVNFNHTGEAYAFSSKLGGSLKLEQNAGTTILTGSNTHTGGTTIHGGILAIGNGGTSGSITGNITNDATLIFNRSDAVAYGGLISGVGHVVKQGQGTATLGGNNTYSGGTTVSGGVLSVVHGNALGSGTVMIQAGTLQIQNGVSTANLIVMAGGDFQRTLSGNLTGAVDAWSGFAGGRDTGARILGGNGDTQLTLSTSFSMVSNAFNDGARRSDVYSLSGTGRNLFVLQLSIADLGGSAFLGWLNGNNQWVNAVEGNDGNNALLSMQNFAGSYAEFQALHSLLSLEDYLGAYGYDEESGSVWAVLNHNSEFAVVPEPSTYALLIMGGVALLLWSKKKSFTAN